MLTKRPAGAFFLPDIWVVKRAREAGVHRAVLLSILLISCWGSLAAASLPVSARSEAAMLKVESQLVTQLQQKSLRFGAPIFIRIFKQSDTLEVWVESSNGRFELFKEYRICAQSGGLGPKQREGDRQAPEGFYFVTAQSLNPWSQFHLSFNLGYPNRYDRAHGRTGSALMVHGNCVSIGCYAMTDTGIEEIYTLAHKALEGGQPFFRVHIFPFKLTDTALQKAKMSKWYAFWANLKEGHDIFEQTNIPPNVTVLHKRYVFTVP